MRRPATPLGQRQPPPPGGRPPRAQSEGATVGEKRKREGSEPGPASAVKDSVLHSYAKRPQAVSTKWPLSSGVFDPAITEYESRMLATRALKIRSADQASGPLEVLQLPAAVLARVAALLDADGSGEVTGVSYPLAGCSKATGLEHVSCARWCAAS